MLSALWCIKVHIISLCVLCCFCLVDKVLLFNFLPSGIKFKFLSWVSILIKWFPKTYRFNSFVLKRWFKLIICILLIHSLICLKNTLRYFVLQIQHKGEYISKFKNKTRQRFRSVVAQWWWCPRNYSVWCGLFFGKCKGKIVFAFYFWEKKFKILNVEGKIFTQHYTQYWLFPKNDILIKKIKLNTI